MKDKVSIDRLKLLHPAAQAIFQKFIEDCENGLNITLRIVTGMRTFAEQQEIYASGRTKPGPILTKAKPGTSFHNYGLAVDLGVVAGNKIDWDFDYNKLQKYMPKEMTWGADWDHDGVTKAQGDKDEHFVDGDHYELRFGFTSQQLLAKYNKYDFIKGTKFLNL